MKLRAIFLTLLSLLYIASPAHAQRDLGGIIDGIFKGGQIPNRQSAQAIDTIPVNIRFDFSDVYPGLPPESLLIVTAYAPPPANVRGGKALMIGETRLLMSDLQPPLQIVIAAPATITRAIDYARIEARIVDAKNTPLLQADRSGEYRGLDPAVLHLVRPAGTGGKPNPPVTHASVRGHARINGAPIDMRGASLNIQLVEDGLAGGRLQTIYGQQKIDLTRQTPPFDFSFLAQPPKNTKTPLVLQAWITDWAGRKILQLPTPLPYRGPKAEHQLVFENHPTTPGPTAPVPTTPVPRSDMVEIKGLARFNAYKGLPRGSVLVVDLERESRHTLPVVLASNRIVLDGLSGDVNFAMKARDTDISSRAAKPRIRARIEDENGRILFSNPGGTIWHLGENIIVLKPARGY